jgi:hypothetical protein
MAKTATAEKIELSLDERVATVLTNEDHQPATTLADLISEVETAISAADEAGQKARAAAVDPRVVDHGASGRAFDAEHSAHRLRNGLEALQQLHQEALAHEKVAQWHSEADAVQTVVLQFHDELVPLARRAEAAELEYDAACDAIDDISLKIYTYMKRCDEIEAAAPPGEARRLPRPIEGLSLAKFMGRKIVPEAPKVETVDYSLATRVWQTAGPALSHDEIVAADEKRREDEQIWLRNIHQSREDRRMEIEAEIHARTRAAVEQKRNYENGL